jgi:ribosomal protein S18 acetylase RimI-like enzyme
MAANPLDNPIWTALTTRQSHFAETGELARKFPAEISPLSAFEKPTAEAYASLRKLLPTGGVAGLFLEAPADQSAVEAAGCEIVEQGGFLQMVYEDRDLPAPRQTRSAYFAELTAADAAEMLALAKMTKPGPFGMRTRELGTYLGIRRDGQLAAMAGERLHLPGYTEISAVCTHPNHLGHGYATALMVELIRRIHSRNETPILHVRPENARAIELYRRLGFADSRLARFVVIRKSAAGL